MANKSFSNVIINVDHLDLSKDASRSVLVTGENLSHSLGKIARWYKDISWSGHKHTESDISDFGTYAGSSSKGGAATSANKLNIGNADIGSETKPVYFSNTTGKPVACTYSLNASVPSGAVFTDEKVKQSPVSTDASYEVLFAGSTGNTEKTEGVGKTTSLTFNPKTGALTASSFSGSLAATNLTGTINAARLPDTTVVAGSYGPAANASPAHGGTFSVPYVTVDRYGRLTAASTKTITLPAQYTHPSSSGNKHIPSGGSSGQILRWSADGTAVWGTDNNTTYSFATGDNSGSFKVTPAGGSASNIQIKGITHIAGDSTGHGIAIGAGGLTVVGAGECATTLVTSGGNNETLYLASDNGISFYTNCDTIANKKGVGLDASLNFYPYTNKTGSLGTSSYYWKTLYSETIYGEIVTTVTDPSSQTSYGILFAANPGDSIANTLRKSNDIRFNHFRGVANTEGISEIVLGNSIAKTAANNSSGRVSWYNANGNWAHLNAGSYTSNIDISLPSSSGTLALTSLTVPHRDNGYSYNHLASYYSSSTTASVIRITLPKYDAETWCMCVMEITIKANYSKGLFGKILCHGNWSSTADWNNLIAEASGTLTSAITMYASDKKYIYISGAASYVTCTVDKILIGDNAINYDLSGVVIERVEALPSTKQTFTMKYTSYEGHTHSYIPLSGSSSITGELSTSSANGFRLYNGGYGAFLRNDGTNLYILLTDKKTDGSEKSGNNWNSLRPFYLNLSTGSITMGCSVIMGKSATIYYSAFEALRIRRTGDAYGASIGFSNGATEKMLGYIGMTGDANGGLLRWKADTTVSYVVIDTGNKDSYTFIAYRLSNKSAVGSTIQPVYFTADGIPATISCTIEKSVPSNAVFTDIKVTQSITTTTNFRPIILGYQNDATHSTLENTVTEQVYATNKIYAQPSTGTIYATSFSGSNAYCTLYSSTDKSIDIQPGHNNEINFGGTNTSTSIYFGYRAVGSRAIPTEYIFGTTGNAIVKCNKVTTPLSTSTHIAGNTGTAIVNSTAAAGYNMLVRMKSTNGVWTMGGWNKTFNLFYTTDSVISAGTNTYTKMLKLLDEDGNSSFPGTVSASSFSGKATSAGTADTATNALNITTHVYNGSTTAEYYGVLFSSNPTTEGDSYWVRKNGNFRVGMNNNGNASTRGWCELYIGNNTSISGSSPGGNQQGYIALYSRQEYLVELSTVGDYTANRSITFPNASGTVSLEGHTHSYLPLAGGTLTNTASVGITFKTTNASNAYLKVYDTGYSYNQDVVLHSSGSTIIGSGESASSIYSNNIESIKGSENMALGADSELYIYTNMDATVNRRRFKFDNAGNMGFTGCSDNWYRYLYWQGATGGQSSTGSDLSPTSGILMKMGVWGYTSVSYCWFVGASETNQYATINAAGIFAGSGSQIAIASGGDTSKVTKRKGILGVHDGNGYVAMISPSTMTENRTITLPNANGTISLEGHTHNYAGSSSAGGAAIKISQTETTTSSFRGIVTGGTASSTAGAGMTSSGEQVYISNMMFTQPSSGTIYGRNISAFNKDGGDVIVEWNRNANASWRMINSGATLYLQCNYTTAKTSWFNVITYKHNYGGVYIGGYTKISRGSFGALQIQRTGGDNAASIVFSNGSTEKILGYIGMTGGANGGLLRWNADVSASHTFIDTGNKDNYTFKPSSHTHSYAAAASAGAGSTKVHVVVKTPPSSVSSSYILFATTTGADSDDVVQKHGNITYRTLAGSTSAEGWTEIALGNTTATGTDGNSTGWLMLYGDKGYNVELGPAVSMTKDIDIRLPVSGGSMTDIVYKASSYYLPCSGGTLTANVTLTESKSLILRTNASYLSGIGYDTQGNECVAIWAKNTVTRLRWHAGVDMSATTYTKMMSITPDFEVSKADGSAKGYIAGNRIDVQSKLWAGSTSCGARTSTTITFTTAITASKFRTVKVYWSTSNSSGVSEFRADTLNILNNVMTASTGTDSNIVQFKIASDGKTMTVGPGTTAITVLVIIACDPV